MRIYKKYIHYVLEKPLGKVRFLNNAQFCLRKRAACMKN